MEGSARGANAGGSPPGARDGRGDSPLGHLSGLADRLRAVAGERLGPDAGERLRNLAGEKLKSVGGDRLPSGAGERFKNVAGALRDPAGATAGLEPFEERPELYVGAAFAGGIALAGFIRLIGR